MDDTMIVKRDFASADTPILFVKSEAYSRAVNKYAKHMETDKARRHRQDKERQTYETLKRLGFEKNQPSFHKEQCK